MSPNDLTRSGWTSVALAALLGASGCTYETTSVVKVPAIETDYPVSASPHYVDAHGAIVRDTEYRVLERFRFERTVESARHDTSETMLQLGPEIDRIVQKAHGDAVARLTIDAVSYDPGSHGVVAFWKDMGWVFTPIGAMFIGAGVGWADADDKDRSASLFEIGGTFAGIGLLSFVLAAVLRSPATWRYEVSGQVVKAPAASPAILPPTPP